MIPHVNNHVNQVDLCCDQILALFSLQQLAHISGDTSGPLFGLLEQWLFVQMLYALYLIKYGIAWAEKYKTQNIWAK